MNNNQLTQFNQYPLSQYPLSNYQQQSFNNFNMNSRPLCNINQTYSHSEQTCAPYGSDHQNRNLSPYSSQTVCELSAGQTVHDANGNVIGILDTALNIIRNDGTFESMRPITSIRQIQPRQQTNISIPPSILDMHNMNNIHTISQSEHTSDKNSLKTVYSQSNDYNNTVSAKEETKPITTHMHTTETKPIITHMHTITPDTMKRGRHISAAQKPFTCTICGKGYKYLCNLRSHSKIHTDKALVCKYCGKRFGRKSNYNEHVRVHTGEAPYKCKVCGKKFKQHHGWKDHMRVHTGEKPYLCNVCGKRFTVGHNLNVHMRIHTGERPYLCNICKKSYRQKSAYNSHIKHVHGIKK